MAPERPVMQDQNRPTTLPDFQSLTLVSSPPGDEHRNHSHPVRCNFPRRGNVVVGEYPPIQRWESCGEGQRPNPSGLGLRDTVSRC
jgi:hypothetical protein